MDWQQIYLVLSGVLLAALGLFALVTALVVVPRNRRPSSATAWIITILFAPVLGVVAFFLIGSPRLPLARRIKQRNIDRLITQRTLEFGIGVDRITGPSWLNPIIQLNQNIGALPMLVGNSASIETSYQASLAGIAAEIGDARDFVHVEFYIVSYDSATAPVFEAMAAAVQRGVTVRVLLDHFGSWNAPGYRKTRAQLNAIGVHWHLMLPVKPFRGRYQRPDLRNHRKFVIVDGAVAWLGSQNLIDRSYNKRTSRQRGLQWQDMMVRLHGPVVQGIEALFVTDWFSETDELLNVGVPASAETHSDLSIQVVPSGPGFETENNLRLFNALLYGARERVSITSPYFVPDESLLYAVTAAGLRGIAIELFVPERGDQFFAHHAQRSYYEQLLRNGVRIYLYPPPFVLHAKHMSVDDDVSVVGSSNLDIRSFTLDIESTLLIHGRSFNDQLRLVENGYREVSRELTLSDWQARPQWQKITDNLARLTSALQ